MKILLDTHLLLWAGLSPDRLSSDAHSFIEESSSVMFSAASMWEIAIKTSLERADFTVAPAVFRRALLDNGYLEIPVTSEHAVAVATLPWLHRDPFDRMLIAQASEEGLLLVTNDSVVARYPGPIKEV